MASSPRTQTPASSQTTQSAPSLGKGQFRCFQCRKAFAMKDGDWHAWNSMEVHLCKVCEEKTRGRPERGTGKR